MRVFGLLLAFDLQFWEENLKDDDEEKYSESECESKSEFESSEDGGVKEWTEADDTGEAFAKEIRGLVREVIVVSWDAVEDKGEAGVKDLDDFGDDDSAYLDDDEGEWIEDILEGSKDKSRWNGKKSWLKDERDDCKGWFEERVDLFLECLLGET